MIAPISSATSSNLPATVANTTSAQTGAKAPAVASKDQVAISKLAQKLATDGDTQAQEVNESGAERASETSRKKA